MNTEQQITQLAVDASNALFGSSLDPDQIQIQPTRKEFDGDFTFIVFPLTRISKKSPEATAELLGEQMVRASPAIESYTVVKGFLNLKYTDSFWAAQLSDALQADNYGFSAPGSKRLVMVEYASPNTNKPLHLGHLRNIFLGYSVAEILKANGHSVKKVQIINDRGIHICKSMVAWQKFGEGETPDSTGMKGDHLVGKYYVAFDKQYKTEVKKLIAGGHSEADAEADAPIMIEARETLKKWENRDLEVYALWEKMNGWVYKGFDLTYKQMGVDFDKLYYESDTWSVGKDYALKALEDGIFYQKEDSSVWVDLTEEGLDNKLVLRKDGTAVYMTQDIGTAILRFNDFPALEQLVYTVGNEQEYHFKVLFEILKKLGYSWAENCYHLSYGMVELPEGKMKSREGTVVDADQIMDEMIGSAAQITQDLGKTDAAMTGRKGCAL